MILKSVGLSEILTIFSGIALAGGESVFIVTTDILVYYKLYTFIGTVLN